MMAVLVAAVPDSKLGGCRQRFGSKAPLSSKEDGPSHQPAPRLKMDLHGPHLMTKPVGLQPQLDTWSPSLHQK